MRRLVGAEACSSCGLRFVRGEGHQIGGAEVDVIVAFGVGVVVAAVPAVVWGASFVTATVGGVVAALVGVVVQRPARGIFYALDYLVEPDWKPDDDDGDDDRGRDPDGDAPAPLPGDGGRKHPVVELPIPFPVPRPDAEPDPHAPHPVPPPVVPQGS